jgi:hypothetical protein
MLLVRLLHYICQYGIEFYFYVLEVVSIIIFVNRHTNVDVYKFKNGSTNVDVYHNLKS